MNYAKVFANNQYLVFKPDDDGMRPAKQPFIEFFENKCYKPNQLRKQQRQMMR